MYGCFNFCTSLVSAPEIPDGVISLESCFYYCTSLVTASEIPNSVTNMVNCFYYCTSLTGEIIINAEITSTSGWSNTFFLVPNTVAIKVKSDAVKNAITSAEGGEGLSNISLMNWQKQPVADIGASLPCVWCSRTKKSRLQSWSKLQSFRRLSCKQQPTKMLTFYVMSMYSKRNGERS